MDINFSSSFRLVDLMGTKLTIGMFVTMAMITLLSVLMGIQMNIIHSMRIPARTEDGLMAL